VVIPLMRITRLIIVGLILCAATCYAELPLVEFIDPGHPSKDIQGAVLTAKDGRKVQVHLRTFGSDQIAISRGFGKSVALDPDRDRRLREKAFELYPSDPFFQKAFCQYALTP
jgi:hypothetical protein